MRTAILLVCAVLVSATPGTAADNSLTIALDWQVSIRVGMEHRFGRWLGVKYGAGVSAFGTVVGDVLAVVYLVPPEKRWQVGICAGVPNMSAVVTFEGGMVSAGLVLLTRCRLSDRVSLDLRVGEGFPFFLEKDKEVIRDIGMPLDLWPDLSLGVCIALRPRTGN